MQKCRLGLAYRWYRGDKETLQIPLEPLEPPRGFRHFAGSHPNEGRLRDPCLQMQRSTLLKQVVSSIIISIRPRLVNAMCYSYSYSS